MDNDLVSIYENNYIRGSVINEQADGKVETDEEEDVSSSDKKFKSMKTTKKRKGINPGAIYADSFKNSSNIFDAILKEMDEMGSDFSSDETLSSGAEDASDDVFTGSDDSESFGDEQTFTVSELKSMTLGELIGILSGQEEGEEGEEEEDYSFEDENIEDDEIPSESYGFSGGEGNYKGDQGNYDGKAKKQPSTTHVKANGDADFGKAETDFDPEDTEGSEGSYLGDQGNYDGKAKKQPSTDLVKANGDANFGKTKLGYKTKSGKKDKNYF